MEHRKILPSHSKIASVVSSRLLPWRDGLTATKRRVPSLLLLVGFGLIVVAAALVVRDTAVDAEDDLKHRVATHAFARNSGENFPRLPRESESYISHECIKLHMRTCIAWQIRWESSDIPQNQVRRKSDLLLEVYRRNLVLSSCSEHLHVSRVSWKKMASRIKGLKSGFVDREVIGM